MDTVDAKYEKLKEYVLRLGRVAVAFSAGVDSSFLLKTAHDMLGENAVAVTVRHGAFPERELSEAAAFCRTEQIEHIIIDFDQMSVDGFADNPPDRCYLCKKAVFGKIISVSAGKKIPFVIEGSNADDEKDYRPGMRAIAELGINSPLKEAGLTKAEIRELARKQGLEIWDKPAYACLATRVPYGETITPEKLGMIERAEQTLFDLGFRQCRVRCHSKMARIEIEQSDFDRILTAGVREEISEKLLKIGFAYVTLDLCGYRQGSLNVDLHLSY